MDTYVCKFSNVNASKQQQQKINKHETRADFGIDEDLRPSV